MKIFSDFHHPSLYYSFYLLFEKRFRFELYRPIGLDWINNNYWAIINLCVNQYQRDEKLNELLIPNGKLPYSNISWNEIQEEKKDYNIIKPSGNIPCEQKAITLKQFKNIKFDIIIASYWENIKIYEELIKLYQPQAKLIVQVGNEWKLTNKEFENKNILASTIKQDHKTKHICFYHQEFDLNIFNYEKPNFNSKIISSCINGKIKGLDISYIKELEKYLLNYKIKYYGKENKNNFINNNITLSNKMKESKFGLHLKEDEDAYGHIIHNWAAIGKPLIYRGSQYKKRLGGKLLNHLKTGIDIDEITPKECVKYIINIPKNEYNNICFNMYKTFCNNINFNEEFIEIKKFLENL